LHGTPNAQEWSNRTMAKRVVKCKHCVAQKRNEANNKNQWLNVLLSFIFKFKARS